MSDVKPALTPEEWAGEYGYATRGIAPGVQVVDDGGAATIEFFEEGRALSFVGPNRHALAALCLHGQAFGFTRDDLAAIQRVLQSGLCWEIDANWGCGHLRSLAERISALLPPTPEATR